MEISNETKEPAMSAKSVNHKDKKHKSPKAFRRKSLKSLGNFMNRILKTLSTLAQVGDVEQPDAEEDDGGFRDSAARALSAGSGIYQDDFPGGREHLKNSATLSSQGSIKGRLSWCYGDKTPGVQGLKNHGNTCFMNAVIQCLSNTDLLAEYLGLEQYKSDLFNQRRLNGVVRNEDLHSAKGEVTEHLASLVRALWTLEYTPQLSVDFKSIVSKYGSQFRGNSQHDALEFLLWLLDRVHEDANTSSTITNGNNPSSAVTNGMSNSNRATVLNTGPPETQPAGTRHSFVQEHFQAQYRSSLTCPHCLKQSNTFDPFLCISLPIPLRQTRAVNVTLVFNSKALRYMRVGLAVPLLGSVSALRALLAQEGNISPEQVILVELYSSGFQRSFSDDDDMTSIAETDVIYAFQAPPPFSRGSSSRYSGFHRSLPSSPHTAGPEGQRSLASGTLSSEFLNQGGSSSILLLVCNTAGSGQHAARFGLPFLMHEERGVSWTELQQNILSKLYYLMVCGTPAQNAGVLFRIRVVGGSASCSYLSPHDSMPLCHPAVDRYILALFSRALKLCGPGGPLHVKLVMEWDADVKERLFGSIQEEVVKDAESVREQQHNHLQQHSCTLDECFQLYTKEEQLAPDDAWRCPHCRQLQQGMVKMSLWTLPDILILHLKRFRQVADRRNKLSTLVRFPPHGLDMAPHVAKRGQGSQRSLAPWPPGWEHGDADFLYDLYAVCNHHGGMHGGHYTAYCRNSVDGQWYGFDDSSVDLIPEEELCTRGAYILFYQRRNAIPPWSASSSLRGSISSSVSDHWLVRLTEDSVRGSVSSRLSASYPPTSPVTPVTPDGPDSPRLPAFGGDAQRNDSGGFETRPLVRSLQNRSASVRSPTKARDTLRKMLPLRWSLGSKDRRKPAPTPVPVPAPTPTPDPVPVPAATPAPAQLVEYLESGRRPRCTNDNIITLMTSSSSKGAAVGQKAASAPQVAEGQQRPASEPGPAQRGSSSGSLPRRSSRRTRQDQAKGQAGGRIGRASETHPADRAESRGDDPKAQDSIVTYLRGSLNRRDVARASGEVEPRPQTTRGGRSLPRMSLPSGSQGRVPGRKTNGVAQPEPHPGAELANGRAVGGGAGDIKRSQSSSSIPRRAEGDMRHTTSLQPSSGSGPRQSMGGERSPRGSLQRARYSSSASLGRRRAVPESSF